MIYLSEAASCAFADGLLMIRTESGDEIVLMPDEVDALRRVLTEEDGDE